jgi:hypothetical protein
MAGCYSPSSKPASFWTAGTCCKGVYILEPLRLEGAKFETGKCLVDYNCSSTLEVAVILQRHAREEYEPEIMLVEVWGRADGKGSEKIRRQPPIPQHYPS